MTDADTYRSTPGNVYGVAIHSSSTKLAEYECPCSCHWAAPDKGSSSCDVCHTFTISSGKPKTATHAQAMRAGQDDPYPWQQSVPDYYFITKGNTLKDELEEHFPTSEKADARASELNECDVIKERRLTKKQVARARRLHEMQGHRWWMEDNSWLRKHKRYAVESWWDDDSSWDTVGTLAEVEEELHDQRVQQVVDLDTGETISFTREVTITL